jgi:D-3-phosphoglycerate dehydrogenase / 2-oxoglutarate reductase
MKRQVIITAKTHSHLLNALHNRGYTILNGQQLSYADLLAIVDQAEGLVVTTRLPIDKRIIDRARKLKWIARLGSGMELIDVEYAKSKSIKCISSPEGNRNAVAEHCLGLLLNLSKKISYSFQEVKQGQWLREENRGIEISGRTIGIIGFGNTGSAFAKLLSSFDVTILVYDKYKFGFAQGCIKEANLDQISRYADVISFHVPLTEETHYMVNEEFFRSLQKKPLLLNSSRGPVVSTNDLVPALKSGLISGAGLDVLENENLLSYDDMERDQLEWLSAQPNVIITPHIAGWSEESFLRMGEVLLSKLDQLI